MAEALQYQELFLLYQELIPVQQLIHQQDPLTKTSVDAIQEICQRRLAVYLEHSVVINPHA
jgi:hypothetical protein